MALRERLRRLNLEGFPDMAENPALTRLIAIVRERSSTESETKLASGGSSNFYFNMKPTMLDPEGAHLIAILTLAAWKGSQGEPGSEGASRWGRCRWPFQPPRSRAIRPGQAAACLFRAQAGQGARRSQAGRGPGCQGETLEGKHIVILEDVTTTGGSSMKAIEAVRAEGGIVTQVITVVDRLESTPTPSSLASPSAPC